MLFKAVKELFHNPLNPCKATSFHEVQTTMMVLRLKIIIHTERNMNVLIKNLIKVLFRVLVRFDLTKL